MLDEVEGGIVTRYEILEHPEEHGQAIDAVVHHQEVFAWPPISSLATVGSTRQTQRNVCGRRASSGSLFRQWARCRRNGRR